MWFLALFIFAKLFWRARETLVEQPDGYGFASRCSSSYCSLAISMHNADYRVRYIALVHEPNVGPGARLIKT